MTTSRTADSIVLPSGSATNERGHLEVGGCDVVDVAREFGTPAYLYAEDDIRSRARAYLDAFGSRHADSEVLYASKAAPFTAAYRILREEGLSVDVASGGELAMALAARFPPERIYMHGNNKTERELHEALEARVGHVICDSLGEIERLDALAVGGQDVLLRITPGVSPSTHSSVQTGGVDSKFGFGLADGLAAEAVRRVQATGNLRLVGLHAHIGSQIVDLEPYVATIEALGELADPSWCRIVNVGGGLGIAYESGSRVPAIDEYAEAKVEGVRRAFAAMPRLLVEPGRSLVGNAGITAYEIGTVKDIPGVRTYVAVDGGMSDNLRPMLYGARYEALIADRAEARPDTLVTIAGMHCESGDILVRDAELPAPAPGDILITPATGAYGHAMANNYNGMTRPPVIMCREGDAQVVVRRETYADLMRRDVG